MCPQGTVNERYINRAAKQLGCLSPWGDHRDFMHRIFKFYFIIWTMHAWSLQRPERVLGPLELELHIVVSHPVNTLGPTCEHPGKCSVLLTNHKLSLQYHGDIVYGVWCVLMCVGTISPRTGLPFHCSGCRLAPVSCLPHAPGWQED